MALPKLLQKLFQNNGAGDKLNPSIIPTKVNGVAADASGNITVDANPPSISVSATTIAAGLPNITGTFNPYSEGSGVATMKQSLTGAFYGVSSDQQGWGTSSGLDTDNYLIGIDASRSSAIYGKSTTVQPPAYALIAWRRTA